MGVLFSSLILFVKGGKAHVLEGIWQVYDGAIEGEDAEQ